MKHKRLRFISLWLFLALAIPCIMLSLVSGDYQNVNTTINFNVAPQINFSVVDGMGNYYTPTNLNFTVNGNSLLGSTNNYYLRFYNQVPINESVYIYQIDDANISSYDVNIANEIIPFPGQWDSPWETTIIVPANTLVPVNISVVSVNNTDNTNYFLNLSLVVNYESQVFSGANNTFIATPNETIGFFNDTTISLDLSPLMTIITNATVQNNISNVTFNYSTNQASIFVDQNYPNSSFSILFSGLQGTQINNPVVAPAPLVCPAGYVNLNNDCVASAPVVNLTSDDTANNLFNATENVVKNITTPPNNKPSSLFPYFLIVAIIILVIIIVILIRIQRGKKSVADATLSEELTTGE